MVRCDEFKDWWYQCDICGRRFPLWWVNDTDWQTAGFGSQDVCKQCFEIKLPEPRYFSVDEYIQDQANNLLAEFPDVPTDQIGAFTTVIKHQLKKVWNQPEETDGHRLCRQSAEVTKKACLVSEDRKSQEKKHVEFCKEHPTLVGLSEKALRPVIREKDPEIKEIAISQIVDKIKESDANKITSNEFESILENTRAVISPTNREVMRLF